MSDKPKIKWSWGLAAAIAMTLLSLYPHFYFSLIRAGQWHGSYAAIEGVGDEVAYSAYLNALISNRPRRSDPYSGRDDQFKQPQPESLFSIQFVPAFLVAAVARLFGVSAATAFILLTPIAAALASLAVFWLLAMSTGDSGLAATGTIATLCLGTVVGGHGLFAGFFGIEHLYSYLMFLRRYQPAASFPLLLIFWALVWKTINLKQKRAVFVAVAAGLVFDLLVFSYVYFWTAALAWVLGLGLLLLIVRPTDWQHQLRNLAIVALIGCAALVPFAKLYAGRAQGLETVSVLELTHRPDLFRLPELLSLAVVQLLAWLIRQKSAQLRDPKTLFALSFALLPFLVFNQQVITGRSLQPLHYEMFVANYSVLIAMILVLSSWLKLPVPELKKRRKVLIWIALAAFEWGAYETFVATRRSDEFARRLDETRPVALRLNDLAQRGIDQGSRATVLASDLLGADGLPTTAPQGVLWAPHMLVYSGVSPAESKERFYQYLYYTGISSHRLGQILKHENEYGFVVGLFGFDRAMKGLSLNAKPITNQDLENELSRYEQYCASFTRERAAQTELSYLIMPVDDQRDVANLDRWYERDGGERVGNYNLYRLRLRGSGPAVRAQANAGGLEVVQR